VTNGEWVNAVDSFAGGLVGAIGAIVAVYLALSRQRKEETKKVSAAVTTEIAALTTYIIGAIRVCEEIRAGTRNVPARHAGYIVRKLSAAPVVYQAVADRIGLLPHPEATAQFYMRIGEVKAMVESLERKTELEGANNPVAGSGLVPPEFAERVAEGLGLALHLAKAILDDNTKPVSSTWVHQQMLRQIDERLKSAKTSFPDAEIPFP